MPIRWLLSDIWLSRGDSPPTSHIAEFRDLPRGDQISRLEGEVWTPRQV